MNTEADVLIDLDRLCANALSLKDAIGDFYSVLKCDAYGHGATECAKALYEVGMTHFAVYSLRQAIQIEAVAPASDILILGRTDFRYADTLIKHGFSQTVFSEEYLCELKPVSKGLKIHIKIDSGMNRSGFKCPISELAGSLTGFSGEIFGVYTHFHCADALSDRITVSQLEKFKTSAKELEQMLRKKLIKHSAASAAALRFPQARMDISRIGLALYGVYPNNCDRICKLLPVMSFRAPIVAIGKVKKGENIGYGCDNFAQRDMYTATVSVGYAGGLHRGAHRMLKPAVNGYRVPFAATVCMDRCILDVTDLIDNGISVRPYDTVEFFGDSVPISQSAADIGTIPYELMTQIGALNPKIVIKT